MKIALVHMRHAHAGGTELFLNQFSEFLAARGHEVIVVCRTHEEPSHPAIKFVVLRKLSIGRAHRMWRFAKAVEKHVAKGGYDMVVGLGKTWSHDVIRIGGGTHYHFLQRSGRTRLRLSDRVSMKIEGRALAKDHYLHVLANSHKSSREVQELHDVPPERMTVVHNAVDTARYDRVKHRDAAASLRSELKISEGEQVVLFLGSGYERKGLSRALRAFAKVTPPSRLVIVGYERNAREYEALAEELGIAERCSFLGGRRDPEVYYSMADCYVLPTRYEPFGYSVIEALSCGVPVITTEDCGAAEVLTPEVSTVLPTDFVDEDLSSAIEQWLAVSDLENLRKKARSSVEDLATPIVMKRNYDVLLTVARAKGIAVEEEN
jgi:UDP-glucose:(heptosyl)LPS alpha-1,3-glucosyltransferase